MAQKRITADNDGNKFYGSLDIGNGECAGISGETTRNPVRFEPVIAPMTTKRGLRKEDERPTFSLKKDGETLVFGVDDVFTHGKRESLRRQNGIDRYTEADYFNLVEVMLLNLFASQRGKPERISAAIAVSLPVEHFNNENQAVVEEVKERLGGDHDISDYDGCVLKIYIDPKKLLVMPESSGALMHWAFDPKTLERRANTAGSTLVIDIGYETTDTTLFEGMKYIRGKAETVRRAGMGNVTRAVLTYALKSVRDADESRVDRALRVLAGTRKVGEKWIEVTPGKEVEVSSVYDTAIANEAQRIATRVKSLYPEDVTRVLLTGGGAYHLKTDLARLLPFPIEVAPEPEMANVYGAYTTLMQRDRRGA